MPSELHLAVWQGPHAAELADMSIIHPGETHLVSSEDLKSAHWQAASRTKQREHAESESKGDS